MLTSKDKYIIFQRKSPPYHKNSKLMQYTEVIQTQYKAIEIWLDCAATSLEKEMWKGWGGGGNKGFHDKIIRSG